VVGGEASDIGVHGSVVPFVPSYILSCDHDNIATMWDEWNGKADSDGETNIDCHVGGVKELEKVHKNKWRKKFSSAQQKYFSRFKMSMLRLENIIGASEQSEESVLEELSEKCQVEKVKGVTNIEKQLRRELERRLGKDAEVQRKRQ